MADVVIQKQIRIPGIITDKSARKRFEALALNKTAEWVKKWPEELAIDDTAKTRADIYGITPNLMGSPDTMPKVMVAVSYSKDNPMFTVLIGQANIPCAASGVEVARHNIKNNPGTLTFLRKPSICYWRDGGLFPQTMIEWPEIPGGRW